MNAERRTQLLAVLGMTLTGSGLIFTALPVLGGPSEGAMSPLVRLVVGCLSLCCALGGTLWAFRKRE